MSAGLTAVQGAVGNQAMQRMLRSGAIQAKLTISQPNDLHEREADQMAEQVMQAKVAPCSCGGTCVGCQGQSPPLLQRKEETSSAHASPEGMQSRLLSSLGAGSPLDSSTRAFMETHFGQDFSSVRVHTDAAAHDSAASIRAKAFTSSSNIVFQQGQYAPETQSGRHLLAHELTHVVQQGHAEPVQGPTATSIPESLSVSRTSAETIQRDPISPVAAPVASTQMPADPAAVTASAGAVPPVQKWPVTGETVTVAGITLTENPDQLRDVLTQLISVGNFKLATPIHPGIYAPYAFIGRVGIGLPPAFPGETFDKRCGLPGSSYYEECQGLFSYYFSPANTGFVNVKSSLVCWKC